MAKFAFVVPPLMGHVNPTLALGAELLQRGHDVGWIGADESLETALPPGGRLLLVQYDKTDIEKKESRQYLDMISRKDVHGVESIKFLYDEVLIPLNRYMFDGIKDHLDTFQPDIVINDHQLFAGAMAAWKKKIRYATSVTAPAAIKMMIDLPGVHEWEVQKIISLQKELEISGNKCLACSESVALLFTSREFFGEMDLPDHFQFVGPVVHRRLATGPFDWETFHRMGTQPRVLISIGTTFDHEYKKDFFRKVTEALGNEPLSVVLASDQSLFEEWPPNFMVRSRVPQVELLPYLDAVVCHGGHNTVCETLIHGLPLVVIPIAYDQSHVASRVTQAESGIRLSFRRFRSIELRSAVWEVLTDRRYRNAARRIQASFERSGGAGRAAGLLEEMLKK